MKYQVEQFDKIGVYANSPELSGSLPLSRTSDHQISRTKQIEAPKNNNIFLPYFGRFFVFWGKFFLIFDTAFDEL